MRYYTGYRKLNLLKVALLLHQISPETVLIVKYCCNLNRDQTKPAPQQCTPRNQIIKKLRERAGNSNDIVRSQILVISPRAKTVSDSFFNAAQVHTTLTKRQSGSLELVWFPHKMRPLAAIFPTVLSKCIFWLSRASIKVAISA